jgi:hypothetical protein
MTIEQILDALRIGHEAADECSHLCSQEDCDKIKAAMDAIVDIETQIRNQTLQAVIEQGNYQYTGDDGPHSDFVIDLTEWCERWKRTGVRPGKDD